MNVSKSGYSFLALRDMQYFILIVSHFLLILMIWCVKQSVSINGHYPVRSMPPGILLLDLVIESTEALLDFLTSEYKMIRKVCGEHLYYDIAAFMLSCSLSVACHVA